MLLSEITRTDYKIIAFDLDDTLAPSKSSLPSAMARQLRDLLDFRQVCVISGGNFTQFSTQLLENLEASDKQLAALHLMPTCGTRYLKWDNGNWQSVYERNLTPEQRAAALESLERNAKALQLWETQTYGPILEDRGSQITFSALGQNAPLEAKKKWDPSGEKKNALREKVALELPELEVRSGGSTSVDITQKGVDKAYGLSELAKQTGIAVQDILFIGDRLDPAGNDYPVLRLDIDAYAVTDWEDTVKVVAQYVAVARTN